MTVVFIAVISTAIHKLWRLARPGPPGATFQLMVARAPKITLGEMPSSGVRGVLIWCSDYRCSHHIEMSADQWPDF